MKPHRIALALAAALFAAGCGKNSEHDHAGHDHDHAGHSHGEKKSGPETTFKAGTGLTIPLVTRVALGFTTAPAEERTLPRTLRVTAQVFQVGPPALASTTLPAAQAATLAGNALTGARLLSLKPHSSAPDAPVDLVFALTDRPDAQRGDFVALTLTSTSAAPAVSIPRAALLRTVSGTFVYVVNGAAYLRTAVVTGAESAEHIAITDGLYAGDEVVTHPVEQLWLIEVHLTQGGGGHSH